jgi:two-component system, chemotaxis family, chemotaxis protein CheY
MTFRKILVIEDSELLQKMYELVFRRYRDEGTQILHALNGREGLDMLPANTDVDLIILDINMPVMSGLEFLRQLKQNAIFSAIPVIIASTEGKEHDTVRGLQAGARGYVVKPFQPDDLHALIERIVAAPGRPVSGAVVAPITATRRAEAERLRHGSERNGAGS